MKIHSFNGYKHANIPPAVWLVIDPQLNRTPSNTRAADILESAKGKVDVVGDIHGHKTMLADLLKTMGWQWTDTSITHPDPDRKLVLLGDLIDGGEHNMPCLKLGKMLLEQGTGFSLMGNHEWQLLAWLNGIMEHPPHNGCMRAFLEEWALLFEEEKMAYTQWLHTVPDNVWFSHPVLGKVELVHGAPHEATQGMSPWIANHPGAVSHARMFGMPRTNEQFQVSNNDWRPFHTGDRWTICGHQPLGSIVIQDKTVFADIGSRTGMAAIRLDTGIDTQHFQVSANKD